MEKSISEPDQTVSPCQIELPDELRKKVVILESESEKGICKVYLVGTCHFSSQSAKDVEAIVSFLKPDVVFLELCESRSHLMYPRGPIKGPKFTDAVVHLCKSNKINLTDAVYCLYMNKLVKKLGVDVGAEMQSAYREAEKYGGKVILGDRPIERTRQRTSANMHLWCKAKVFFQSLGALACIPFVSVHWIESMISSNMEAQMANPNQLRETGCMAETKLHERDLYMASGLYEVAKESKSVVAVVGMGHVAGIHQNWKKPIQIKPLMEEARAPKGWQRFMF